MSVTRYSGTAMHAAVPVKFQMTLFTLPVALLLPTWLSLSHAPCCSHMSDAWAEGGQAFAAPVRGIRRCGLYTFFVLKTRFCAGYKRVRGICAKIRYSHCESVGRSTSCVVSGLIFNVICTRHFLHPQQFNVISLSTVLDVVTAQH